MEEIQVWSLGREDSLEKEMATHSSILAWEIPWTEEPGGQDSATKQQQVLLLSQEKLCISHNEKLWTMKISRLGKER